MKFIRESIDFEEKKWKKRKRRTIFQLKNIVPFLDFCYLVIFLLVFGGQRRTPSFWWIKSLTMNWDLPGFSLGVREIKWEIIVLQGFTPQHLL